MVSKKHSTAKLNGNLSVLQCCRWERVLAFHHAFKQTCQYTYRGFLKHMHFRITKAIVRSVM